MPKPSYEALEEKVHQLEAERDNIQEKISEQAFGTFQWQWQRTFDAVNVSICVLDPDWTVLQCNKATSDLLDTSCDNILGHKCFELVHGTIEPIANCPVRRLQVTKKRAVEVLKLNDKWIEVAADPVLDMDGNLTAIVHIITDITEQKEYERELEKREQKFRSLAELLPQTVFEMEANGHLTFVNNTGLEIFGYTHDDLAKGLNGLDLVVPQERENVRKTITAILEEKNRHEGYKCTALRKDGSMFPILIYAASMSYENEEKGIRGIIVDISEQEKLSHERDQLEKQYIQVQKMEAIGRLAGGVAHDLNNMLSPIVGYGELLLETIPKESPHRNPSEQIYRAGIRARDMVQQLLAFSRKQALEIKTIDINQVLSDFESLLARILRDDIQLELTLSDEAPHIQADAGQIEQVVMNLAINSQDAMQDGGIISIEVDTIELDENDIKVQQLPSSGTYARLTFSDTGCGMDEETIDKIFDPFFTTKSRGKGTGLGLATVYGIVKQHNGNIRVYSEPGKGTVFRVYFPCTQFHSKAISQNEVDIQTLYGTERILIAEDNDVVRQLAESILQKYGYHTMAVSGGAECEKVLSQGHVFDLFLTDVILQDTNGKELYRHVKACCPGIKVIYMSGYTGDIIGQHGVLEEGISFIQKPFSYRDLLQKVRQRLDARQSKAALSPS